MEIKIDKSSNLEGGQKIGDITIKNKLEKNSGVMHYWESWQPLKIIKRQVEKQI